MPGAEGVLGVGTCGVGEVSRVAGVDGKAGADGFFSLSARGGCRFGAGLTVWVADRSLIINSGVRPKINDTRLLMRYAVSSPLAIVSFGTVLYAYRISKLLCHSISNISALNGSAKFTDEEKIC